MSESYILLIDGIEYSLWIPRTEDELEKSIKHHSKKIFGPDSIYFDIKKKIKTSIGLSTIPDSYLIDFKNEKFYLIEVELSSHPEYDHINKQIGRFIGALRNYQTRQKIASILKEYIELDLVLQKFVYEKIGNRELYQFFLEDILEKVKEQNYHTIIVVDKITRNISEACNILSPRPKILEFKTFVRKNVGDLRVHCHLFEPLISDKKKTEKIYPSPRPATNYTGKIPEKIKIFDKIIEVKYWKEIIIYVAEELIKRKPKAFEKIADSELMEGSKRVWLSKERDKVYKPHQLSNGLFLDVSLNANAIYRNIKYFLNSCGYEETDIEIFLRD